MGEVVGATGDTVMATATAITGDMDLAGGAILTAGVIRMRGVILTGGTTPTIPPILTIHTMALIMMKAMGRRRRPRKRLPLRWNRDNSNLLIGASVRTPRVIIPTLKIARGVG